MAPLIFSDQCNFPNKNCLKCGSLIKDEGSIIRNRSIFTQAQPVWVGDQCYSKYEISLWIRTIWNVNILEILGKHLGITCLQPFKGTRGYRIRSFDAVILLNVCGSAY